MVILTPYFDDSGTDPNQRVANATALIIPAAQISRLEAEWAAFLKKHGFTYFHTSECVHSTSTKSEFGLWDPSKRECVFRRVVQIAKKYGVQAISYSVNKKDYREVIPGEFRSYIGEPYTWAVRHVVSFLDEWRTWQSKRVTFEYVFSHLGKSNKQGTLEIEEVMAQAEADAEARGRPGGYRNYSFCDPRSFAGLQCVDAIAWTCYQIALSNFYPPPAHQLAVFAWNFFGGEQRKWLHGVTITRANLRKFMDEEGRDGRAVQRFREWKKQKRSNTARHLNA
jgi:Protein of unknown function (DUF3800)